MTNVYTHGHHESVLRSHRWRTAENSAGHLLPLLRPGMRLLDVGCGPGTITMDLAELVGPEGRVTALERTDEALDLARAEAERRAVANVDFVVGDVQDLDVADGSFDVVHAHQVLQHVDDPVRGLREMARVCRAGGTVAARESDYSAFTWFPRGAGAGPVARGLPRGGALQRRRARRRSPAAVLGAGRGPVRRAARARAPGATRRRSTGPGGAGCGPTGSSTPTSPGRPSSAASPPRPSWPRSPTAGGPGRRSDDGWFSVLHGEILATP